MAGALAPGMPLPLSTTTFMGRARRQSPVMRAAYSAPMSMRALRPRATV